MLIFPLPRDVHWSVHKVQNWSTIVHKSISGGRLAVPLYPNNPLWSWEFTYEVLLDDSTRLSYTGSPYLNTLYTDLQIIEAFYFAQKGAGGLFFYQPPDSTVTSQLLSDPDSNNNSEIVHTIGGYPTSSGMQVVTESVQAMDTSSLVVTTGAGGVYSLQNPGTTAPYEGYVLHWTALPTPPIHASFNYYYQCAFSEDNQDYEQFTYNLYTLKSIKFEQVRVTTG